MKVTNFYDNKNQFIIEGEKGIYFQSYESIVAKIEKNGILKLGTDWDFSKTTLKYLYKFIAYVLFIFNVNIIEIISKNSFLIN